MMIKKNIQSNNIEAKTLKNEFATIGSISIEDSDGDRFSIIVSCLSKNKKKADKICERIEKLLANDPNVSIE